MRTYIRDFAMSRFRNLCPFCLGLGYSIWSQPLCVSLGYRIHKLPCFCAVEPIAELLFGWLP